MHSAILFLALPLAFIPVAAQVSSRQAEPLDRGVVVMKLPHGNTHIGWRLLLTDPADIAFNVYRLFDGGQVKKLDTALGSALPYALERKEVFPVVDRADGVD